MADPPSQKSVQNQPIQIVPGNTSYANVTKNGKAVTVFSDSIASRIKKREMNMYVQGKLYIQAFKGATAKYMETYVTPTLEDNTPDVMVPTGVGGPPNEFRSPQIPCSNRSPQ